MENVNIIFSDEHVSASDMGVMYGLSLFETFLVNKNQNVFLLEKHIERMLNSAQYFGIDVELTLDEFKDNTYKYISENNISNSIVRMTLTAGNKQQNIHSSLLFSNRVNNYTPEIIAKGCKLDLSEVRRSNSSIIARHKTGNYLENYYLLQNALKKGYDDVVFLNANSQITETSKCNIFFVRDGILYTPNVHCGLLDGIIREWIIDCSIENLIECVQGRYYLEDLINADEMFVCNSAMGIMHVNSVFDNAIKSGNITKLLQDKLHLELSI